MTHTPFQLRVLYGSASMNPWLRSVASVARARPASNAAVAAAPTASCIDAKVLCVVEEEPGDALCSIEGERVIR